MRHYLLVQIQTPVVFKCFKDGHAVNALPSQHQNLSQSRGGALSHHIVPVIAMLFGANDFVLWPSGNGLGGARSI